jgi:hypothetical protein
MYINLNNSTHTQRIHHSYLSFLYDRQPVKSKECWRENIQIKYDVQFLICIQYAGFEGTLYTGCCFQIFLRKTRRGFGLLLAKH